MPDPTGRISHRPEFHRGVSWKQPCRVATTATVTIATALNAGDTIDGVVLVAGDRVLVKDQSTGSQNGIYYAGVTPARDFDMDQDGTTSVTGEEVMGAFVYVIAGTLNGAKVFRATNTSAPTLGSTTLTFTQFPGTSSGAVPWSYAKADGGLVGDGATNDTAAFQAWITSVTAAGTKSGWFFFEPGTYLISGALQDTGAFNGQILLPNVSTASAQITLTFQGPEHPPFAVSGALPAPAGYAILKSNLTGAAGTAAVISGGNGTWPTKNNICVVVQDLVCVSPTNPTMTFWNLQITQGGSRRGLFITTTDWAVTPTTQPTNSNSYGIKLPQWGQTNGSLEEIMVGGHYTGILQGELCDTHAIVGQCARAIEFPFSEHASKLHLHYTACTYGIYVTGAHIATIWLDSEHFTQPTYPAWLDTLYDLYDPSNYMTADLDWFSLDGLTQVADNKFTVSGGAKVNYRKIGAFATRSYVVMVTGSVPPDPVLNTASDDWVYSS